MLFSADSVFELKKWKHRAHIRQCGNYHKVRCYLKCKRQVRMIEVQKGRERMSSIEGKMSQFIGGRLFYTENPKIPLSQPCHPCMIYRSQFTQFMFQIFF
jgi:hypothetical protein